MSSCMVAEAWISEVGEAAARERALRTELASLVEERAEAEAALGAVAAVDGSADGRSPEEHRVERLELARERHRAAEERHRAHLEAEQEATALVDELAVAVERERAAVDAAAAAEAALAAVARREVGCDRRQRSGGRRARRGRAHGDGDLRAAPGRGRQPTGGRGGGPVGARER